MTPIVKVRKFSRKPFGGFSAGKKTWFSRVMLCQKRSLGGSLKYLLFSPLFREMIQFEQYFSNGLKPPTRSPLVSNGKDFLFAIGDEVKDIKIV